ncbi:hypothetical protein [Fodinicola feengrottensis]|uniref:DUF1772 domain-containing protein n=1 Tax=Fodinicola feengrottensis TaxID=435914 RepID=A0ABN2FZH6_9ACTN|nr:hypothetical protein [Fodinicola feengrottensis]
MPFATATLAVAAFGMIAIASVGGYQAIYVFPTYFSAPPASLRRYQADTSWKFWLPLHAITFVALVLATIGNLGTGRAGFVLAAVVCYLAAWIATLIWFIPGVVAFNKVDVDGPDSPELKEKGRRWLRDSTARLVLLLAAAVLLVIALPG